MKIPHLTRGHDADSIRNLVERFLDGDTTPAQEQAIYTYYASHSELPGDLESYRPMFGWYAAITPQRRKRNRSKIAGIAAAIAVIVVAGVALIGQKNSSTDRLYASYKGSYIIRDGQKIDDISLIYANLACAELMADSIINQADQMAKRIEQSDDILIENVLSDIDDPQLAKEIKEAFYE